MVTPELLNYIKQHLDSGHTREAIEQELIKAGWHPEDIHAAFAQATGTAPIPAPAPTGGQMPSASQTLKQAWEIYKKRLWTLIGISLVPALLFVVGGGLVFGGWAASTAFKNQLGQGGFAATSIVAFILFLALIAVAIYISVWSQVALLFAIKDHEERIGVKESFKRSSHKIGSYFGASLVSGFVIMGGFLLFIIPGIIFAIWYSLSTYVVVGDNTSAMSGFKRSREYVRGMWGNVFLKFLFIGIVYFAIYFVIGIIIGIISGISGNKETSQVITQSLSQILSFFLAPLVTIYGFQIYKNLKAIKGEPTNIAADAKGSGIIIAVVVLLFIVIIGVLTSVILLALSSARAKSRDAKRVADVRQLMSALELYRNDKSTYPQKLKDLEPEYIYKVPVAPTPNDGSCSPEQNTYSYSLVNSDAFNLTFCLGGQTGGLSAGKQTATEEGLNSTAQPTSNSFSK